MGCDRHVSVGPNHRRLDDYTRPIQTDTPDRDPSECERESLKLHRCFRQLLEITESLPP